MSGSLKEVGIELGESEEPKVVGVSEGTEQNLNTSTHKCALQAVEVAVEAGERAVLAVAAVVLVTVVGTWEVDRQHRYRWALPGDVEPEDAPHRLSCTEISAGPVLFDLVDPLLLSFSGHSEAGTVMSCKY